jgi:hypothetical protein
MTPREPAGEGAGGDVSGVDVRGTISPLSAGAGGAGAGHAEYQAVAIVRDQRGTGT